MNLGKNIKRIRESRGLRQQDLAQAIGTNATYVSVLENGHKTPGIDIVEAIARALSTTPNDLLGFDTPEDPGEDVANALDSVHESKLSGAKA